MRFYLNTSMREEDHEYIIKSMSFLHLEEYGILNMCSSEWYLFGFTNRIAWIKYTFGINRLFDIILDYKGISSQNQLTLTYVNVEFDNWWTIQKLEGMYSITVRAK